MAGGCLGKGLENIQEMSSENLHILDKRRLPPVWNSKSLNRRIKSEFPNSFHTFRLTGDTAEDFDIFMSYMC